MTETHGWIWTKPTNVICLNLTKNWQWPTFTLWTWPKRIDFDRKLKILKIMAQRQTFMVEYRFSVIFTNSCLPLWWYLYNFWFSVIFNRQCSSLWQIFIGNFGQVHQENVRHCQFSVTFPASVKLTTLILFLTIIHMICLLTLWQLSTAHFPCFQTNIEHR